MEPAAVALLLRGPDGAVGLRPRSGAEGGGYAGAWSLPALACEGPPAEVARALASALGLDPGVGLRPLGRVREEGVAPAPFETQLFAAPDIFYGEREGSGLSWARPDALLAQWATGSLLLQPWLRALLEDLSQAGPDAPLSLAPLDRPGGGTPLPGVHLLPLQTPTLPPATHTNCYLLGAGADRVIVDPGAGEPEALAPLLDLVRAWAAEGIQAREIWLTHEHHDHSAGVAALKAALEIPCRAHPAAAAQLPAGLVDAPLLPGEVTPARGQLDRPWEAIHTPGHVPGHLCLFQPELGALIAGDLMAAVGTILVAPPEGDMAAYFASLRRARALEPRALFFAHGAPSATPTRHIDAYLAHRQAREDSVVAALAALGPSRPAALLPEVYGDLPEALWGLATLNLEAHLQKLVSEGRARPRGGADLYELRPEP